MVNHFTPQPGRDRERRIKHDIATENIFRRTIHRATAQGMKVNIDKTGMLVVHDSMSYAPEAYIVDSEGSEIHSTSDQLRIVGFNFDHRPDPSLHVEKTIEKVRRRYWVIRHLKQHGLNCQELVKVYCSVLRSVIEYASVVYGPMLTGTQEEELEKLQSQSLKIVFGFDKSYRTVLELSGLETLGERRRAASLRFARKCLTSQYSHWFPLNEATRQTRHKKMFREDFARCERLKNSPIYRMRRLLNEEEESKIVQR
jgi:hypothetical protein